MTFNEDESKFGSKELNRILPSYLLHEICPEQVSSDYSKNNSNNLEENIYDGDKKKYVSNIFDIKGINNYKSNDDNKIFNNSQISVYKNNNDINNVLKNEISGNDISQSNIIINFVNNNINKNKYIFCNYNNNTLNDKLNTVNCGRFNWQLNKNNHSFANNNINAKNKEDSNLINLKYINEINNNSYNNTNNTIHINNKKNKIILLDDFMKHIKNIKTPIVNCICNSKGALDFQRILEKSGNDVKIYFIQNLGRKGLIQIMKNVYGNYFFQKLIKNTSKDIVSLILLYVKEDFITISKDSWGTFSIQALLHEIKSIEDYIIILEKIKGCELELIYDKNATYVIQKIVLIFPDYIRENLNEIILNNFIKLCLDVNGICLIKNFIKTNNNINNKIKIKYLISNNFILLSQSPFGNYAVQFLMENWNNIDLIEIFERICENILVLSVHQFSSNVVEKGLEIMDEFYRGKIINKIFMEKNFIFLSKNKFGKFVINKAYNIMKPEMQKEFELFLVNNMNNNIFNYKNKNIAKQFLIKIHKENNKNNYQINSNNMNDKNF